MSKLILVRHGQSVYNQKNIFTGWTDIELSLQGEKEAKQAGELLKKNMIYPDICFTSWLKRAIHTTQIILKELEWEHIDVCKSWKLNERHYGAWQGKNKEEIKKNVGEKIFSSIRRGYETPPPPLKENDKRLPIFEKKYQNIDPHLLPKSESLKDTQRRVLNYYFEKIVPFLAQNKDVLISAHGNSLRALAMYIENIDKNTIMEYEIPTGEIIIYNFDDILKLNNKIILKSKLPTSPPNKI